MQKKIEWFLFLTVWLPTVAYFVVQTVNNFLLIGETLGYSVFALGGFIVLMNFPTDEPYYKNLNFMGLLLACVAGIAMFIMAYFIGSAFNGSILKASMATLSLPLDSATPSSLSTLPSSVMTNLLSDLLFTLMIVAAAEEIFKFAIFAGLQVKVSWYVAAVPAVLIWSWWHLIEAYPSLWQVIPVMINGFVLILLLQYTKSFLTPIISHGLYNGIIIIIEYWNGQAPTQAPGMPLFPVNWTASDIAVVGLWAMVLGLILIPVVLEHRRSRS